jgi:hypothetical protein
MLRAASLNDILRFHLLKKEKTPIMLRLQDAANKM